MNKYNLGDKVYFVSEGCFEIEYGEVKAMSIEDETVFYMMDGDRTSSMVSDDLDHVKEMLKFQLSKSLSKSKESIISEYKSAISGDFFGGEEEYDEQI